MSCACSSIATRGFAKADTDKDGKLSKAEFDAASKQRGEHGKRPMPAKPAAGN
ncbi:EF hand domain-containing protein [Xanthomonas arboricola pv. pruni str. MAFF 311562]|uniref:EF hand domain-containing protein n=1 Tax=Xanthomonas arboricola pv. pruni str. MAFF 311562 TaxID=1414836 RepID=W4RZV9_9XANT|nr:EF hand domain-containing protein [Xanthomonas arboricola pv. pruni str. MAFF 311562]